MERNSRALLFIARNADGNDEILAVPNEISVDTTTTVASNNMNSEKQRRLLQARILHSLATQKSHPPHYATNGAGSASPTLNRSSFSHHDQEYISSNNNIISSQLNYQTCLQWIRTHKLDISLMCDMLHLHPMLIRERTLDVVWQLLCETEPYYTSSGSKRAPHIAHRRTTQPLERQNSQTPAAPAGGTGKKQQQQQPLLPTPPKFNNFLSSAATKDEDNRNRPSTTHKKLVGDSSNKNNTLPEITLKKSMSHPTIADSITNNSYGGEDTTTLPPIEVSARLSYIPKIYMMEEKLFAQADAAAQNHRASNVDGDAKKDKLIFPRLQFRSFDESALTTTTTTVNRKPSLYRMDSHDDLQLDEKFLASAASMSLASGSSGSSSGSLTPN